MPKGPSGVDGHVNSGELLFTCLPLECQVFLRISEIDVPDEAAMLNMHIRVSVLDLCACGFYNSSPLFTCVIVHVQTITLGWMDL